MGSNCNAIISVAPAPSWQIFRRSWRRIPAAGRAKIPSARRHGQRGPHADANRAQARNESRRWVQFLFACTTLDHMGIVYLLILSFHCVLGQIRRTSEHQGAPPLVELTEVAVLRLPEAGHVQHQPTEHTVTWRAATGLTRATRVGCWPRCDGGRSASDEPAVLYGNRRGFHLVNHFLQDPGSKSKWC